MRLVSAHSALVWGLAAPAWACHSTADLIPAGLWGWRRRRARRVRV